MMGGDGSYGRDGSGWELWEGGKGQQHCCWESLRDYSLVKLKLQPSQTELLFRSVVNCFFAIRMRRGMEQLLILLMEWFLTGRKDISPDSSFGGVWPSVFYRRKGMGVLSCI